MTPDGPAKLKRLGELLEELRTDHALVYYGAVVLFAFGVMGILCMLDAILKVSRP